LEKRAEQVLPGSNGDGGREGVGDGGRNGPNNVCTNEQMHKEKKEYVLSFSSKDFVVLILHLGKWYILHCFFVCVLYEMRQ
jgi:hypothetical protein